HLLVMLLAAVFCSGAMVFLYAWLLRLAGRERFDGLVAWWQLGVTAALIFGYQLVPRMIDRVHGFRIDPATPGLAALPPAWFASLDTLLTGGPRTPVMDGMAAAALFATLALSWAAVG